MTTAHDKAQAVVDGMRALKPLASELRDNRDLLALLILPEFWLALEKGDAAALRFGRGALAKFHAFATAKEEGRN